MRIAMTMWLLVALAPSAAARTEGPFQVQGLVFGHDFHGASVVRDPDAGRLDLYYSGRSSASEPRSRIWRRTSTDAWVFAPQAMVWEHTPATVPGESAPMHATDPTVIRVFNHVFQTWFFVMYYTRLHPGTGATDIWAVSSPDGVSWGAAGLVIPGGKEPSVVDIDGNDFWIYYRSTEDYFLRTRITGIFNVVGTPTFITCDGNLCLISDPTVAVAADGTSKMVASAPHPNDVNRLALYQWISTDGVNWTGGTQPLVATSASLGPCSSIFHATSPAIELVGSGQTVLFFATGPDKSCHGEDRFRIDEWWLDSSCNDGGLRMTHAFPGKAGFQNVTRIVGAQPNSVVLLSLSFALQPTAIPGCAGTTLLLQQTPILAPLPTSVDGNLVISHAVSASIAGLKIGMQLFDTTPTSSCGYGRVSNPVIVEF